MKKYIINDAGVEVDCLRQFGVEILEPCQMTEALRSWEGWSRLSTDTTRIILPGNGATDVAKGLGADWLAKWSTDKISATRFWWPGSNPVASVGLALHGFDFQTQDVVIIDDVISSGATIQKVRDRHEPWMPKAKWHALTWIAQRNMKLKGFTTVYATAMAGDQSTKAPINSLSTILAVEKIAKNYAQKNFSNEDCVRFLEIIRELRQ